MLFRWFCLFYFVSLSALPLEVEVSASSAILMNAESGAVLFEKHAHVPAFPASITKIATALVALEKGVPFEEEVVVSAESLRHKSKGEGAAHWLESDGTRMGLKRGERVSMEALFHGLLLVSGNDAANVIAEGVGGSVEGFVEEMNRYVRGLGCLRTNFCNPHGLHHPEHSTTAYDIALIMKRALRVPEFREIVAKRSFRGLKQNNPLVKPGKHFYAKAIGGKTGYTAAAKHTLVAAAEDGGRVLIAVVLGCEKREERYRDVVRLFEAAFGEEKVVRRFFGREHLFCREVEGAKGPLKAELEGDLEVAYYPAEEPVCRAFVRWEVELPVKRGEKVGEVWVCDEKGGVLKRGNLVAKEEVKEAFWFRCKKLVW